MDLKNFFAAFDQTRHIKGIEGKLRRRQRNGLLATFATLLIGFIEIFRELSIQNEFFLSYLSRVGKHTFDFFQYLFDNAWSIFTLNWDTLPEFPLVYGTIGFYLILLGITIFILFRHSTFLLRRSEQPFQYTFWIEKFEKAEPSNNSKEPGFQESPLHYILHHDLMDMLNRRIGRFSILDEKDLSQESSSYTTPPSHIHLDGHYTFRERDFEGKNIRIVQVMPRVRIGPSGNPSILTLPVEVELEDSPTSGLSSAGLESKPITEKEYQQVLEQVYSKVATEIYKQIKVDIKQKIHLFPTKYLRAVALYYEAEDFSRSNTIDSYDYALELYQEALRFYDISVRSIFSNWLLFLQPFRFGTAYEMMHASTKIGYAKCLIYRREISSLTGRTKNPLFEVPTKMNEVAHRLVQIHNKFHILKWKIRPVETGQQEASDQEKLMAKNKLHLSLSSLKYRNDTWTGKFIFQKPNKSQFEHLKKLLFDSYVVMALAYANLGAYKKADENLENAKAAYPEICDSNALFIMTQAEAHLDVELKVSLLIQATEMASDFEIAQYLLAKNMLYLFLLRGEVGPERAGQVIREFYKVLKINPGNIASFAHLGYLYWLIEDLPLAKKHFDQGIKSKALLQQTFIGELNYGLARISSSKGEFNKCFDLYSEAISTEPGLGAYSIESVTGKARTTSFYDYITPSVLTRYRRFKEDFERQVQTVLLKVYEEDFINFKKLKKSLATDVYQLLSYFSQTRADSLMSENEQVRVYSKKDLAGIFNQLLSDPMLSDYILVNNKKLTKTIRQKRILAAFDPENKISVLSLNRQVLEMLYPGCLRKSGTKDFFQKYVSERRIIETGHQFVSTHTLNRSYSYILNDYGNACLNYFHRFGDNKQLEEAIHSFDKAIQINSKNGIAYYNMANAAMWRNENSYDGILELKRFLEKADENMSTPWPKVIIECVKYQMTDLYNNIRIKEESIQSDRNKLESLEMEIKEMKQSLKNKQHNDKTHHPSQSLGFKTNTVDKIKEDLDAKKIEKGSISERLQLEGKLLKKIQRDFESKFTSAIKRTIGHSRLTSIIEGYGFDLGGKSIARIINLGISVDRLDEMDLEVLKGWAELLGINPSDQRSLEACVKLCQELINKWIPQDFGIDYLLLNTFLKLEDLEIEKLLYVYPMESLFLKQDLESILGKEKTAELLAKPTGSVLTMDKDRLFLIRKDLKSPHFKSSDIANPERLIHKINQLALFDPISIKNSYFPFKWKTILDSVSVLNLTLKLNRLIKTHFFREDLAPRNGFTQRTQELIRFELEGKLKGDDLLRFNRRLLEEIFPEEIIKSNIELYRERISDTIKHLWLAYDPVFFVSLNDWAKTFSIFPEFESALKKAININTDNVHVFHNMLAALYEKSGHEVESKSNYEQCIRLYPQQGVYSLKLAQVLKKNQEFDAAKKQIQEAKENGSINANEYQGAIKDIYKEEIHQDIQEKNWIAFQLNYQKALNLFPSDKIFTTQLKEIEKEYKKQKTALHYGDKWADQMLIVTPIAIEVATDLIPLVEREGGGLDPLLQDLVNQMRNRVLHVYGVRIPGIRFRGNDGVLPNGNYIIFINEIPLFSGTISLEKQLYTGSKSALESSGLQFEETLQPMTGDTAYWIQISEAEKAHFNKMDLWERMEYPLRHLEEVIYQNLGEFLGHQEVFNLIEENCFDKSHHYRSNRKSLTWLTTLLRALVREKVPITAITSILNHIEQHPEISNLIDLNNQVRLLPEVRKVLPGNQGKFSYWSLGQQLEKSIEDALVEENGQFFLAMAPEKVNDVLSVIRDSISNEKKTCVVVGNQRLRPVIFQLIKMEFPLISVISSEELMDLYVNGFKELGEIEYENS